MYIPLPIMRIINDDVREEAKKVFTDIYLRNSNAGFAIRMTLNHLNNLGLDTKQYSNKEYEDVISAEAEKERQAIFAQRAAEIVAREQAKKDAEEAAKKQLELNTKGVRLF